MRAKCNIRMCHIRTSTKEAREERRSRDGGDCSGWVITGRVLIATTPPPSGARAQAIPPKPHRAKPATTSPTPSLRLCEAKPSNLHRRQLRQLLPFFPSLSLSRWLAPRVWGDATRRDDRSVHKSVRRGLVRILPRCSRCRLVASLSVETPVTAAASLFTRWCFCVCVFVCVCVHTKTSHGLHFSSALGPARRRSR